MENNVTTFAKSLYVGICALLLSFAPMQAFAAGGEGDGEEFNAKDMILHHVMDDYGWHIAEVDGHHVSIPLPIILITDGQLDLFMSSDFHHEPEGMYTTDIGTYKLDHGDIVETSGKPVLDFSITKNVASMMLAVIILFALFLPAGSVARKSGATTAPEGKQNLLEALVQFIIDDVMIPNIGEKHYRKYVPYIMSIFFFIWVNNLLGLIPTAANASGNIAFTATLAVFTLIVTNVSGTKDYWKHIFWTPGVPLPIRVIILPIELLGIFTKPFALMVRLFANITAGHIIILSLLSFIFISKTLASGLVAGLAVSPVIIAMNMLELFVAALQAYIFALLSSLFIGMAVEEHGDH